jgi:hypothetical protein
MKMDAEFDAVLDGYNPIAFYKNEFQGRTLYHMRTMWGDAPTLEPTPKGVAVDVDFAPVLMASIIEVVEGGEVTKKVIERPGHMTIVVSISEFKGKRYIDVRNWFTPKGTSDLCPTKKGVSIPVERGSELVAVLRSLMSTLKAAAAPSKFSQVDL